MIYPTPFNNLEQLFHCGVRPLKVASPDADLGRYGGVHGEPDPSESAAQLYLFMSTADNHLRIEAFKLPFEPLEGCALHFGFRAQDPKGGGDRLLVGSIAILEGYQYAYLCSPFPISALAFPG